MRHVILTCEHHPELRWSTKEVAVSDGRYNGARHLYFNGTPSGEGMYSDGSGLHCKPAQECDCPTACLRVAPEDALVTC